MRRNDFSKLTTLNLFFQHPHFAMQQLNTLRCISRWISVVEYETFTIYFLDSLTLCVNICKQKSIATAGQGCLHCLQFARLIVLALHCCLLGKGERMSAPFLLPSSNFFLRFFNSRLISFSPRFHLRVDLKNPNTREEWRPFSATITGAGCFHIFLMR